MRISVLSLLLFAAASIAAPLDAASAQNSCKSIIMIYARGTWEPGNPPSQVAAPLISALNAKYPGKVDPRILQYDGGASGYLLGGSSDGTNKFAQMTTSAATGCPNSKLLLVGYSQGAQVLHNAAKLLSADVLGHVKAVVLFGDPFKGQAIRGLNNAIVHTECYAADMVCNGLPLPVGAHNQYDQRIDAVTQWIVQTLGKV